MTKRMRAPVIWAALICALLVGAYVIVARNAPATGEPAAGIYMH